jgi:hypothetical protein
VSGLDQPYDWQPTSPTDQHPPSTQSCVHCCAWPVPRACLLASPLVRSQAPAQHLIPPGLHLAACHGPVAPGFGADPTKYQLVRGWRPVLKASTALQLRQSALPVCWTPLHNRSGLLPWQHMARGLCLSQPVLHPLACCQGIAASALTACQQ